MEMEYHMAYGQRYDIGNFTVVKYNKVLRKREVNALRTQMNIPLDLRKNLQRSHLPYIKITAKSGMWALEFCCNTAIYHMLDTLIGRGKEEGITTLAHWFNVWFMDTTVLGDNEYQTDKAVALQRYMERQEAGDDDTKALEEVKAAEEAKARIVEMGKEVSDGE